VAAKGLTECWRETAAAKQSNWQLRGLVLGPREANPAIHGAVWYAWATGPKGRHAAGSGPSPEDALLGLALELRRL
jgi:hypothetical protein